MPPAYDLELRLVSHPRYLCVARAAVGAAVEKLGFPQPQVAHVMVVVDEAVSNVIRHGYGGRNDQPIWVRFRPVDTEPPSFELVIEDLAKQVDLCTIKSRDLEEVRPGGLGVHLIREIMDTVKYSHRPEGGMRLVMTKVLQATKEPT